MISIRLRVRTLPGRHVKSCQGARLYEAQAYNSTESSALAKILTFGPAKYHSNAEATQPK